MSDLDYNYNYSSDDEPVSKDHKRLLQAVGSISKQQHIKRVSRKEPSVTQNEFALIKTRIELPKEILPAKSTVSVVDLVKTLKGTSKHLSVGKELKNVQSSSKVLSKPLDKPAAERVARTINYEKTKKQLARWDAVVAQFQSAESQTFPLDSETVYINTSRYKKPLPMSLKSELQIAVDEAEAKLRALKGEKKDEHSENDGKLEQMLLTKEELKKRRQELAYLKMRQSQKSAKLRLQNKIKSKKYHRLLKQHKLKEQLKEFEMLQKQNPEEALDKLKLLEKNRVLERANLRHKNTGTWAKNNLVKAKYNKEVQKDLSEQLALSRQLTVKEDMSDDDEDLKSEDETAIGPVDPFNPWMQVNGKQSVDTALNSVENSYRKYWMNRNENERKMRDYKSALSDESAVADNDKEEPVQSDEVLTTKKVPKTKKNKRKTEKKANLTPVIENGWIVEDLIELDPEANLESIDKLFDKAEDAVLRKITKKQLKMKKGLAKRKESTKKVAAIRREKNELKNLEDLTFKKSSNRIEIDEELIETAAGEEPVLPTTANLATSVPSKERLTRDTIVHDDFVEVKPIKLKTSIGGRADCGEDLDLDDEDEEVAIDRQATINDAFEDDDIVAEFEKQKNVEEKKALAEQLTLSMPGWGSWAGTGITQKKKELVLQFEKSDDNKTTADENNKNHVRINDNVNKKLREHLVSDIPFPFTSVKDYEASIRAPIGRSFVPESAFRMLTKPAVITRRGHIIQPMDETELLKPAKRLRSVVEKRILYDSKVAA